MVLDNYEIEAISRLYLKNRDIKVYLNNDFCNYNPKPDEEHSSPFILYIRDYKKIV